MTVEQIAKHIRNLERSKDIDGLDQMSDRQAVLAYVDLFDDEGGLNPNLGTLGDEEQILEILCQATDTQSLMDMLEE